MSIADLLAQATPQAQYYDYDRKIMEDYDNRAKIYSDAFDKYQKDFADYQTKVDDFNLMVDQYNKNLADPTFTGTAPVFKGGAEPIAPVDPGFSQGDIDAFIDEATARATRRGQTAATAFNIFQQGGNYATAPQVQGGAGVSTQPEFSFSGSGFADGGAVVPPPNDPPVVAPARNEGALGLGYYIPPELRQFGRNVMNFAGAIDPVQGIMRGMRATGRAFDSELSPEERKAATIEAILETLAPVGMIGMGALAKQPIKATLMDVLTPTGAPASMTDEAVEAVSDPSRRAFMKGAAATGGITALLPDLAMEAMNRVPAAVTKTAAKAVPIGAVNTLAAKLSSLRKQNDNLRAAIDDLGDAGGGVGGKKDQIDAQIYKNQDDLYEDFENIFNFELSPEDLKNATNDSLEEIASFRYDVVDGYMDEVVDSTMETMDMQVAKMEPIIREAKSRGLDKAKDKNGISMYPNAATLIDEFDSYFGKTKKIPDAITNVNIPNIGQSSLKMTDDFGKSTEDLASEYLSKTEKTLKLQKIDRVIADGKVDNLDADEINKNVLSVASREGIPFPKRAFDDENVQYVSTSLINQTIPRGNAPRYNVGEFFPIEDGVGKIAPATDLDVKKFLESEKKSLKEEIFSEGIKNPIEIKLSKKTGEAHIGEGHHRLDAALELGIEEVPIIVKVTDNELLRRFMTPIKVNTKGLKANENYSFDKINFLQRIERPRPPLNKPGEFAYDEFDRPLSLYGDFKRGGIDTIPDYLIKPMRPGMYRVRNVDKEYLSEAERELLRNSPDVPLVDKSKYADGGVVSFAPYLR
tara:strand:+ start:1360 stop:3780 length:2421 start_codon:yes stop_codon:yes gene_type:complete